MKLPIMAGVDLKVCPCGCKYDSNMQCTRPSGPLFPERYTLDKLAQEKRDEGDVGRGRPQLRKGRVVK